MKKGTRVIIAVLFVIMVLGGAASAYYVIEMAPQPNMQVTAVEAGQPARDRVSQQVQDQGTVSGTASFSYTVSQKGDYYLAFDNTFSFFSSKYVSINYTVGGKQYNTGVSLGAGQTKSIYVGLDANGQVSGSFKTVGGSGNDVTFYIVGDTCNETVPFSFTLVNSGTVAGYATVAYQSDGSTLWTNKYYVTSGQQLPVSGAAQLSDCGTHNFSATVMSQQKA